MASHQAFCSSNSSARNPHPAFGQPLLRSDRTLYIDRLGSPIPTDRCFKCNCAADHEVRRTFSSTGGLMRYLIVLQPLLIPFLLPFFLLRQDRASVAFGLCGKCQERRLFGMSLGAALVILSVPLLVYGAMTIANLGLIPALAGAVVLTAGLLTMARSRHLADPKEVKDRWIVLRGGGDAFLEGIPQVSARQG